MLLPATARSATSGSGTLPYLLMKPVSRLRLILGKYAAVLLVTVPALLAGAGGHDPDCRSRTSRMRIWDESWRRWQDVDRGGGVTGRSLSAGELVIPGALLAGMIYIFAWEPPRPVPAGGASHFQPGVRAPCIRRRSSPTTSRPPRTRR